MRQPLIGIIGGQGKMGKLFADFFQEKGLKVLVSDVGTILNNKALAKKADIVIVSVPIEKTETVIREIIHMIGAKTALMDFTSVKTTSIHAMLKGSCEVLGLHPMFGNTNPIPGQTVIVCPTVKSGPWSQWMMDFLKKNDVRVVVMSASGHDKLMNTAQGLIHFADIAFSDSLRRMKIPAKELLKYTGKASELKVQLAARLIGQNPDLYGNIQIQNPYALESLREYKKSIDELLRIVTRRDLEGFKKYFLKIRKFFGDYIHEAYNDSSHLIDCLMELQKSRLPKNKSPKPLRSDIAILGPKNTFSDLALKRRFPKASPRYVKSIKAVFEWVAKGRVEAGLVPLKNSLSGPVRETQQALKARKVKIVRVIAQPIHLTLAGFKKVSLSSLRAIYSHSQAFGQCRQFLRKKCPQAKLVSLASTAAALKRVKTKRTPFSAAIAAPSAIKTTRLTPLRAAIEDRAHNTTWFALIKRAPKRN